jgi:hypothetical protein
MLISVVIVNKVIRKRSCSERDRSFSSSWWLPSRGGRYRRARGPATCHDLTNLLGLWKFPIQSNEIENKSNIEKILIIHFALFRRYHFES